MDLQDKKKEFRYRFISIEFCNMCGSDTKNHRVLGKRLNQSQGKNPKKKAGIGVSVQKCSNCGLIYSNPQPIPFDLQDHYGIPPEDYWKENYFTPDPGYFKNEIEQAKQLIDFKPGMKSLDIGAGLGKAMLALKNAGFDAYGFEPSAPFYERAINKMGISIHNLQLGSIESIEYTDNSFDFISFGAVLEHLYDPSGSILKALKWLKPQGIIHIEVPSSEWLIHKIIRFYYRFIGTDYVGNLSPMHEPFHLYEFHLESFRTHAKLHGYELAFHQYYVCQTYMPGWTDFILKPYMKWSKGGMQLCVWLRKK